MIYELQFREEALKEWHKLGATVKEEFKTALAKRLEHPRIPKHALYGMPDHYKSNCAAPAIDWSTVSRTHVSPLS